MRDSPEQAASFVKWFKDASEMFNLLTQGRVPP